jgi:hypothetical protein
VRRLRATLQADIQAPLFAIGVGIGESALVARLQNIIKATVKAMATHRGLYVG